MPHFGEPYWVPRMNWFVVGRRHPADYLCDGVADDVQIQQAIIDSIAAGCGVFIAPGQYNIANSVRLPDYAYVAGSGYYSLLRAIDGLDAPVMENDDRVAGNVRITLENFRIDGNKLNQTALSNGIDFLGAGAITDFETQLRNLWVENMRNSGIFFKYVARLSVVNCFIKNCAIGSTGGGIHGVTVFRTIVQGNDVYTNLHGIFMERGEQMSIIGNNCIGNGENINNYGASNRNTIMGNLCIDGAAPGYGILMNGAAPNWPSNIKIIGNIVYNNATSDITINPECERILTRDNQGFNPFGVIVNPFHAATSKIVFQGGDVAVPVSDTWYTVMDGDVLIRSTGGTVTAVDVRDPTGATVLGSIGHPVEAYYLPFDHQIRWTWTGAPTVVVSGL